MSLLLPLVTPPLEDPVRTTLWLKRPGLTTASRQGTSVWETVCNSLLCSRVLVARSYHQRRFRVLGVGVDEAGTGPPRLADEACPHTLLLDDILFHLKDQMETGARRSFVASFSFFFHGIAAQIPS